MVLMRYRFDDVEVDTASYRVSVGGETVDVEPQVLEVLAYLIERRDRLVPRTELLDNIWGDRFVSDSALASRIKTARAVIGDDGKAQRYIRTIHGRGFQFVAPVEELGDVIVERSGDDAAHEDGPDLHQTVRFVTSVGGAQLAVATIGSGTPMVKAANWLTHVDHDARSPLWRHWLTELGSRFTFVRYDARGCGLSDRDLDDVDLTDVELWTDDLEAVVESIDADRIVLLGVSQGAVPAIAYANRRPDRVSHLILYGAYARGMRLRGAAAVAESDTLTQLMRTGWGGANPAFRTVFTMNFMPAATAEQMRWLNELQIRSSDAANALRLESAFHALDVRPMAACVTVPTLVMHARNDLATPYEEGRRLAATIPGAEFVTLESDNHLLLADESAWDQFLAELDRFLAVDVNC
jgi:DNA-binding winged helix-turn-helix (wHTH) protein/alpha-beta hydrolase superfamily lysophospholipase